MKSVRFAQLSTNDAQVPRSLRGQSPRRSALYLKYSDAFPVDLEVGIVESCKDQGQPSQDCHATFSPATFPCATASPTASPRDETLNTKVFIQDNKPEARKSKLTNLEGTVSHGVGVAPCSPAVMPTSPSQLPEKILESNKATEDLVQSPLYHVDTKQITLEVSSVSADSPKISSIPTTPQKKPAFSNYKSPTVQKDVLPEGGVQTSSHSHSHTETHEPSRPDKKKQAKRSNKANQAPKDPGVKIQGFGENTIHTASNLPRSTAKSLKRNATLSGMDEDPEGQKNKQKSKKAKKVHESRFDLDEAMLDGTKSLPEMAANSPNPNPKRKSQSLEAEQVVQKQPKRARKCDQTKGIEDDVMIDVDPAKSRIPTVAPPTTPAATATSLKRGIATPEANGAAISSKAAKRPKQRHEGELPIDVCVEFEDITQLVDARLREKEEKREEERKRREAPKILKRSRSETAAAEAGKSAKKPKTAERAEEAEKPELPKKRGRGSDDEAEKPKKKTKSNKD